MSVLVIAEIHDGAPTPGTRAILQGATQLPGHIDVLLLGRNLATAADAVSQIEGVAKVLVADAAALAHGLAEACAPVVVSLAASYNYILAPGSTFGKNLLPRVAAILDVSPLSDVTAIVSDDTFIRPIYAGNAMAKVRMLDEKKLMTLRPAAFSPSETTQAPAPIEQLDVTTEAVASEFISQELTQSERPELASARIVVSGGRGFQSGENFKLLEQLADKLGAAIGASRAAVDAGFVPNDYQVGQTGKVVAPDLYIAIGISGAIQHLAGMKESKVIVAINKDEEAPIFQIADYGLVADLFTAVPEFIACLDK